MLLMEILFVRFDTASTLSGQSYVDEKRQRNICLVIRV